MAWAALGDLDDAARGYELLMRAKGREEPAYLLRLATLHRLRGDAPAFG